MKQLLLLLLFPCFALAQYQGNANQKITLGEQTTADGLVWRGVAADTTLTVKSDTAAYFVLDTVNLNLYTYKASASGRKWRQLGADTAAIAYVNTYGTQTVNGAKTFTSELTATRFNPTSSTATGTGMFLPAANTLGFSTNGTNKLTINASGNLGLGVTPSAWRSTNPVFQIGQSSSLYSYSSSNITGLASNVYINSSGNEIYIANGTATTYTQNINGEHRWNIAASGTAGNAISFTQAMTLDASGRLGIGTTSPTSKLDVRGTSAGSVLDLLQIQNESSAASSGSAILLKGYYNAAKIVGVTQDASFDYSGYLAFQVNNPSNVMTERMRLDASGRLGIGTTTPTARLQVKGSGVTSSTTALKVDNSGNTNLLTVLDNGNVGIGTTSPASYYSSKLVVSVGDEDGITIAGVNDNYLMFADGTTGDDRIRGFIQYSHTSDYMAFATNAGEQMRITSAGEVWIGYTADQGAYRLQVKDSVYVGGNVSASAYTTRSDYDLKDEIQNISYGINEVMQMQPVKYTYKSNGSTQLGFIAQDLGVITPEVVSFEDKMSVYYNALIPILTKAIQEQNALIKALEQRIINLENK